MLPLTGSPGGKEECPEEGGKRRTNHPTPGRFHRRGRGRKGAVGREPWKKDVNK